MRSLVILMSFFVLNPLPIVEYTPVTSPSTFVHTIAAQLQPYGPYPVGSDLYAVANANDANSRVLVFKSSDKGVTWALQDWANGPDGVAKAIFSPTTIQVAYYVDPGTTMRFRDFDIATGLWGSDYGTSGGPVPDTGFNTVLKRSNNNVVVIYLKENGGFRQVQWAEWNGATWSTNNAVTSNSSPNIGQVNSAVIDPATDNVQIVYQIFDSMAFTATYFHVTLDAANALGTPNALTSVSQQQYGQGTAGAVFNGKVYFAHWDQDDHFYKVWEGNNASAPSSFTKYTISAASNNGHSPCLVVSSDGLTLYLVMQEYDADGDRDNAILTYSTSTNGSTWSTPVEFFSFYPVQDRGYDQFSIADIGALSTLDIPLGVFVGDGVSPSDEAIYLLKISGVSETSPVVYVF